MIWTATGDPSKASGSSTYIHTLAKGLLDRYKVLTEGLDRPVTFIERDEGCVTKINRLVNARYRKNNGGIVEAVRSSSIPC